MLPLLCGTDGGFAHNVVWISKSEVAIDSLKPRLVDPLSGLSTFPLGHFDEVADDMFD